MTSTGKEAVKIASLEIEDLMRVKLVEIEPAKSGLTVIGGNNKQGKSTILKIVQSLFGGKKFDPSNAVRDGEKNGHGSATLSNGIDVEKSFTAKGSYLKVIDPDGEKAGMALLSEFISEFALDLAPFMNANAKQQARIMLEAVGVDLTPFEERHKTLYDEREIVGRQRRKAEAHAEAMPYDETAGMELFEPSEVLEKLQGVMNHNAKIQNAKAKHSRLKEAVEQQEERVDELEGKLSEAKAKLKSLRGTLEEVEDSEEELPTEKFRKKLSEVEESNARVRKNLDRKKALSEAESHDSEYKALTEQINENQDDMKELLDGADMRLDDLTVDGGRLIYKGQPWDCMSGSEQLIVATAICTNINPKMGFVLIDRIESFDPVELEKFGAWLEEHDLQAITTRVSTGDECSIIIEDGCVQGEEPKKAKSKRTKTTPKAGKDVHKSNEDEDEDEIDFS